MVIAIDIDITPYGLGTYTIVVTDKYSPELTYIVVDDDDLKQLRSKIDKILNKEGMTNE